MRISHKKYILNEINRIVWKNRDIPRENRRARVKFRRINEIMWKIKTVTLLIVLQT